MNRKDLWLRLRALLFRRRVESELQEELEFHIEMQTRKNRSRGATDDDAARQARAKFGSAARVAEECRDERRVNLVENLLQDMRQAIRMMRRNSGFTAVAVISLALGIGANAAIFTLIDAVLLKSLPVRDPASLVLLGDGSDYGSLSGLSGSFTLYSAELYKHIQGIDVFEHLGAVQSSPNARVSVRHAGSSAVQPAGSKFVSGNYFEVLGVRAALGRTIVPSDESESAPPVAVVSFRYWKDSLNGDASAIGSTIELDDVPVTIIGVAPPEFHGETLQPNPPSFWFPISAERRLNPESRMMDEPDLHWLYLLGRLKPDVSWAQAQARLTAALQSWLLAREGATVSGERQRDIAESFVQLTSGGSGVPHTWQRYSQTLRLLLGISLAVLLITCANIANLLLARGTARSGETSVRLALGASRGRLIRQSLAESLTLAFAGGAMALLVAWAGARLLLALFFSTADYVPIHAAPDARVLAFTFVLSCSAAVVFGMLPALRMSSEIAPTIRGTVAGIKPASLSHRRFRLGKTLIIAEVGLSLVVLTVAGSFVRSLANLTGQEFGFNRENVLVIDVDPMLARFEYTRLRPLYEEVYSRLNALPGVKSAAFSFYSPFNGCCWGTSFSVQGYTPKPEERMVTLLNRISPGYFETLGTKVLVGRTFDERDTAASQRVAVVDETFAKRFFPNESPIGKRFGLNYEKNDDALEIVGVVERAKYDRPRREPEVMAFLPLLQPGIWDPVERLGPDSSHFINAIEVRTAGNPSAIAGLVRQTLSEIDPRLPVLRMNTLSGHIDRRLDQENLVADLAVFFGALGLVLACVGLYGLMAYMVQRRTGEIGIRIALGAPRGAVVGMVVREALVQGAAGILIGIPAAFAASQLVAGQLYGVRPGDPQHFAVAAVVLVVCITIAGYLPARRASRVDPTVALRHE
jgi:predicted permease